MSDLVRRSSGGVPSAGFEPATHGLGSGRCTRCGHAADLQRCFPAAGARHNFGAYCAWVPPARGPSQLFHPAGSRGHGRRVATSSRRFADRWQVAARFVVAHPRLVTIRNTESRAVGQGRQRLDDAHSPQHRKGFASGGCTRLSVRLLTATLIRTFVGNGRTHFLGLLERGSHFPGSTTRASRSEERTRGLPE
jgi:hypothetical protein